MKFNIRFLLTLTSIFATCCFALATGVIVRVTDPGLISAIVIDYPVILGVDQAGSSPFVRFEVSPENVDPFELALQSDARIKWAEEEDEFDSPENQSSHGSSVAAIYDRSATFSQNKGVWKQINFSPPNSRLLQVRVGIVDTGVSHLQPSILQNVVASASFVPGSPTIDDYPANIDTNLNGVFDEGAGHGTMIAGIILQMAPRTPLIIAKAADSDGVASSWSVMKGVVFCFENGSRVINISLGGPNQLVGFSEFLEWVSLQDVTIISPIGNGGANTSLFPAGYSSVINVTGLLPDNTKAPFSNWTSGARVAAPATGILSAWYDGGTAVWSGTSFSAPLATASLVSALSVYPRATASHIRRAFTDSGTVIDNLNPNYRGKLGKLLNFGNLLSALKR